jgi:hypothetical protein
MKVHALVFVFIAALVVGGVLAGVAAGQGEPAAPAPIPVTVASSPAPASSSYTADDWIKILGAVGILVGSIGGLIVTIQGNRARLAAELRAERAAELRADQLRAVATTTGAPVIPPRGE